MNKRWRIFDRYFDDDRPVHSSVPDTDAWQDVLYTPQDKLLPDSSEGFQTSFRILKWIILATVFALLLRLSYLQLVIGSDLYARGEQNYLRVYVTRALRGIIYDRDRKQLVENIPHDNAAVIPADLPQNELERATTFTTLSNILNIPEEEIAQTVEKYRFLYTPITIKSNIDHETKLKVLSTFTNQSSGVLVVEDFSRHYLSASQGLAHALGYLNRINEYEWEKESQMYTIDTTVGKSGIEKVYEKYLRGRNGEKKIVVNAKHTKIDTLFTSEPENGCDLVTALDSDLNQKSYELLQQTIRRTNATGGSIIIMNPQNGQILSLVSLPDFDNNLFADGIKGKVETEKYEQLLKDKNTPFLDRAISGTYPPGSTFKIVTASGILENNIVTAEEKIEAPGFISVPNQFNPTEHFIYKDWKKEGHGQLNIIEAIAASSDTFFYKVTGGFEKFRGLGVNALSDMAKSFGLGKTLGIDLPGEQSGTVPTPDWKNELLHASWVTGDTYNYAIGQGYLLTTPLQVAGYTSLIAANGKLYQPYIVKAITNCANSSEKEPQVIAEKFLQAETIAKVKEGMHAVIYSDKGTAKSLRTLPFEVGGKTGTAQFNNNQNTHAWFTAFAPYENPEVVITVMVEGGGEGGEAAVPIAKELLQWWGNKYR
ncbi:MAG: penicillin-binding protein 2 [Candidatus Abawacabacteria bacterium]|nr:penicillin-binding protein 2 [Candidatus Abawacabacteria bacterium]